MANPHAKISSITCVFRPHFESFEISFLYQWIKFHSNRSIRREVMTSHLFSKWRPLATQKLSPFCHWQCFSLYKQKSVHAPNCVTISPSQPEILLLSFSKKKRPPYWNSTSGLHVEHTNVICMHICSIVSKFLSTQKWKIFCSLHQYFR